MKNTLFILREAVRVCGRRASRRVFTRAVAGRARQSTPTQFIILFIDPPSSSRGGADVCNYIALGINFSLPPK